ncbi:MAG: hypothetical protein B7X44_07020 [Halothiobacillus sp. 15-55-196]|jgi:uncharacterized protein (TIGR02001 family)|uniref:TorF family putative porin n=1 Tax=Halothiobacillus sp. 15-55-196 TaxID=1970382 RepID=UPI000BD66629|nr:TorF family putative porin [Halothiobacillus sp. 15-55-196]OZB36214.1 MAG: hypothetical protein B7X44_07020 [Halothiobacillus sp. 15-55-196]
MNKFKKTLIVSSVVASLSAFVTPSFAADAPAVSVSGTAAVVSDYRFRGISQSYKNPAVQVGINVGLPAGFYAGFWGSSVSGNSYNNGASLETDWFAGYAYKFNDDFSVDVGGLYYWYPGASITNTGIKYNTFELHVAASYKWLTAKYNITTTDFFGAGDSKGSAYYQLDGNYPLTDTLTLNAHVGHQKVKGTVGGVGNSQFDYTDWLLGATYTMPAGTFAPGWSVGLAYVDTNAKEGSYTVLPASGGSGSKFVGGPTAVLTISKSF